MLNEFVEFMVLCNCWKNWGCSDMKVLIRRLLTLIYFRWNVDLGIVEAYHLQILGIYKNLAAYNHVGHSFEDQSCWYPFKLLVVFCFIMFQELRVYSSVSFG